MPTLLFPSVGTQVLSSLIHFLGQFHSILQLFTDIVQVSLYYLTVFLVGSQQKALLPLKASAVSLGHEFASFLCS